MKPKSLKPQSKLIYLLAVVLLTGIALLDHLQPENDRVEVAISTKKLNEKSSPLAHLKITTY